jgi:hypothetical protein
VKGITFGSLLASLERMRGRDAVDATFRVLPPHVASPLRLGEVVSSGWYPVEWYRTLLTTVVQSSGEAELDLAWQLGRDASISQFRGIHRLLLRVISSELLVSQAPKIFRMYFDGGEVAMAAVDTGMGVIELSGWHGFDRLIWTGVMGGLEGFLVARRAFDIRHRVLRGGGSDGSLKVEYRWSMSPGATASERQPAERPEIPGHRPSQRPGDSPARRRGT